AEVASTPGCSIKHSFCDLDPTASGFRPLFRATWVVARRETLPPPDGRWTTTETDPDIAILAAPNAGATAHRSATVVGLANVFPQAAWPAAAAAACTVWAHATVVGYETEPPESSEPIGELVVWTNGAQDDDLAGP